MNERSLSGRIRVPLDDREWVVLPTRSFSQRERRILFGSVAR
jgi:hypothetical protein